LHSLEKVHTAILLIIIVGGSADNNEDINTATLAANQNALQQLKAIREKRLIALSDTGQPFEEHGTLLEERAKHTANWFEKYIFS
jgi:ABC-type Fe3+-hydroxamate transport system substrate-binding protein